MTKMYMTIKIFRINNLDNALPRPSKTLHAFKILRELIFGSVHHFHVMHCTSRNYIWKAGILSEIDGVGH